MGDLAAATRSMMWLKDAISSRRWDNYESNLQKVEQALQGLPDAEKAEIVAELAATKQDAEKQIKAEKAGPVQRDLDRRLASIDPQSLVDSAIITKLKDVLTRLGTPEVTSVLDAAVIEQYRSKIMAQLAPLEAKNAPATAAPAATPVAVPAANLGAAKPVFDMLAEVIDRGHWDRMPDQVTRAENALEALPDPDKTAAKAKLAAMKQHAEQKMKAENAKKITSELDRKLGNIDPQTLVADALTSKLDDVVERLESDEVKSLLEASVLAQYRSKIDAMRPGAPAPKAAGASAATGPAPTPANLSAAKRELMWLRDAVQSRYYDSVEARAVKVEELLAGVADADKAPLLAELAEARAEALKGIRAEKARSVIGEIERKITFDTKAATARLAEPDIKELLDPEQIKVYRDQIAAKDGAAAAELKGRRVDKIESLISEFEAKFGDDPFRGQEEHVVRQTYGGLESLIKGAHNNLTDIPAGDADGKKLGEKLADMQKRLDGVWAAWEQATASRRIVEAWTRGKQDAQGWEQEADGPSWEEFSTGWAENITSLYMPKTRRMIDEALRWLNELHPMKQTYPNDADMRAAEAEARAAQQKATAKIHKAYERVIGEAEKAPLPPEHRELEKTQRIVQYVGSWLSMTPHFDAAKERAEKLHAKWKANVESLDTVGAGLYAKLEAEALEKWPKILAGIEVEQGFDPADLAKWQGKTVYLKDVWNRAGWDHIGGFHFAVRVNETPVAGDWDDRINAALGEAVERTRKSIDDHESWDIVGIVQGPGQVKTRTHREWRIEGTSDKFKTETWETEPCVVIKIIAMRAGPVAIGPE